MVPTSSQSSDRYEIQSLLAMTEYGLDLSSRFRDDLIRGGFRPPGTITDGPTFLPNTRQLSLVRISPLLDFVELILDKV